MRLSRRVPLLLLAGFVACALVLVAVFLLGAGGISRRTSDAYRHEFIAVAHQGFGTVADVVFAAIANERSRMGGDDLAAVRAVQPAVGGATGGMLLAYDLAGRQVLGEAPPAELTGMLSAPTIAACVLEQRLSGQTERQLDNFRESGGARLAIARLHAFPGVVAVYGQVLAAPDVRLAYLRNQDEKTLLLTLLWGGAGCLVGLSLIGVLVMRALHRRLLAPLTRLTAAVQGFEAGGPAPAEPIPSPGGDDELTVLVGAFRSMAERISQRRDQLEAEVRERTAALQATLDALPDLLFEVDGKGVIHDSRARRSDQLYAPPESFLGRSVDDILPGDAAKTVRTAIAEAHGTGTSAGAHYILPFPEGVRHFELSVARKGAAGADRFIALVRDITERQRMAEALQAAREQAEAASQAKSAFLAHMSHEIRTPLNAVLGYAQLLARSQGLDERQREQLRVIQRSGDHLLGLLQDVLEISRIESRRVEVQAAVCSPRALVGEVVDMLRLRAADAGIGLAVELRPYLPGHIELDVGKLRQIVINLVGNAVKYTQRGGVRIVVGWMASSDDAGRLSIAVHDTGPGMDAAECARIFAPFVQGITRQAVHDGAGLGLSISRGFARAMGGEVSVASQPGQGSVFTLEVPARIGQAQPPPAAAGDAALPAGLRVLIADDLPTNREMLRELLQDVGCVVGEADDGETALAALAEQSWDVVLMDVRMPRMDGLTATRRIRADARLSGLPVLALTGGVTDSETASARNAGVDGILGKPFRLEELCRAMLAALRVRAASRLPGPC